MEKEDIIDNEMVQILVRILYEEYLAIQTSIWKVAGLESDDDTISSIVKEFFNWSVGEMNNRLKGFIIVPELFLKYTQGREKFEDIGSIVKNYGSLFEFFKGGIPDDKATVISNQGIAHSLYLDKIVGHATEILGKNWEDILKIYLSDISRTGARIESSVAATVLLNNQDLLESRVDLIQPPIMSISLEERNSFYDGRVYCKKQTITNLTYTGPIFVFDSGEIVSAEFFFQKINYLRKGLMEIYFTKRGTVRKEFLFDKEVVGVLRIHRYSEEFMKSVISERYLIKPEELGINTKKLY